MTMTMTMTMTSQSDPPPSPPTAFIGCDVDQAKIVVLDSRSGKITTVANQPEPLGAFAATLDPTCLVICEATGGYEAALLAAVIKAGYAIHRADARKVKAFIRSFGTLGKTDAIDARALARYGAERHAQLARWQAPDQQRDQLQSMVLARRDLISQRVACGNRLAAPQAEVVRPFLTPLLACLVAQIEAIDAAIAALIHAYQPLDRATKIICGQIGMGFTTAASLIALLPELGRLSGRQIASLGGLAPHPRQSGATDAYRRIIGGRTEIKSILFMAALSAAQHDPKLRDFYQRLLGRGKQKLVALAAVMRKMLVICNAMLRADLVIA